MRDDGHGPEGGTAVPGSILRVLPAGTMEGVALEDHLAVASAAGFDLVSFRPRDLRAWLAGGPGRALSELTARSRELGLGVAELDPVTGWSDPTAWADGRLPAPVLEDLDLAAAVGARAVTALVAPGERWAPGPGSFGFDALCGAARERGVAVQLEPFGWSELWDVEVAVALVEEVGAHDAGVLVDTWHLDRRGGGVATVEALPVVRVLGLQVSDGPTLVPGADLRQDCFSARTWPGEPGGELHPERVLASLLARGWSGPVAVEVFGDASDDPLGRGRRAAVAFDAMLAATRR